MGWDGMGWGMRDGDGVGWDGTRTMGGGMDGKIVGS